MYRNRFFLSLKNIISLLVGILLLFFSISFAQEESKEKQKKQIYNGIPIYEPYFNSFDLKTTTTEEVESIKQ